MGDDASAFLNSNVFSECGGPKNGLSGQLIERIPKCGPIPWSKNELTLDSSLSRSQGELSRHHHTKHADCRHAIVAVAALHLNPNQLSLLVLFGSGAIFPLWVLIDRLTQRRVTIASAANPVMQMFMQSLGLVVLTWPLVILAARHAYNANLIVLSGTILMGIIWNPMAKQRTIQSACSTPLAVSLLSYVAFVYVPPRIKPPPSLVVSWRPYTACCG